MTPVEWLTRYRNRITDLTGQTEDTESLLRDLDVAALMVGHEEDPEGAAVAAADVFFHPNLHSPQETDPS